VSQGEKLRHQYSCLDAQLGMPVDVDRALQAVVQRRKIFAMDDMQNRERWVVSRENSCVCIRCCVPISCLLSMWIAQGGIRQEGQIRWALQGWLADNPE
jgi:hypothetical protein